MLVEDWRPKLFCKGLPVDNISPNQEVLFIDENHKYYHQDDIVKGALVPFYDSQFRFRSPTGIIESFKETFDAIVQSEKYVVKHGLDITPEELRKQWSDKGLAASTDGTILHAYAESLWNGWNMPRPDHPKAILVEQMYAELSKDYDLVKTELLLYSKTLRLAGQVDLLLRSKYTGKYALMDYKFIKELKMKSFYNGGTKSYKMMSGPFSGLQDCSYSHYSVQMELYKMLMPKKMRDNLESKTLIVVTPKGYKFVEGQQMRIWVDRFGHLQATYIGKWNKKFNSSRDRWYGQQPYELIEVD